ncbi:MAG: hypothetical protein QM802_20250 [Agriterribacter sp.]
MLWSINGLAYYDFDGQEFLFNNGHGYYSAKRFFNTMFTHAKESGVPYIRFTGPTLSESSNSHYQSIWNVGGGKNLYDVDTREWGITTSQGKDLRDVMYPNFFPVGMGEIFPSKQTLRHCNMSIYKRIYFCWCGHNIQPDIKPKRCGRVSAERNDFCHIHTWENARAANAFPRWLKKELENQNGSFIWNRLIITSEII